MIDINDIKNTVHCADCLDIMKQLPDKCIDLVLTDPPYGIGEDGGDKKRNRNYNRIVVHEKKEWDKKPETIYFSEIFRISKNQVICGANYFVENLKSSMGWIFWDKKLGGDFSDGEILYTSFAKALRKISISNFHNLKGGHDREHPTQKPVALFEWILKNYSTPGMTIFDPFAGSGTTAIACLETGRDYILIEKEPDYVEIINKRIATWKEQGRMFSGAI